MPLTYSNPRRGRYSNPERPQIGAPFKLSATPGRAGRVGMAAGAVAASLVGCRCRWLIHRNTARNTAGWDHSTCGANAATATPRRNGMDRTLMRLSKLVRGKGAGSRPGAARRPHEDQLSTICSPAARTRQASQPARQATSSGPGVGPKGRSIRPRGPGRAGQGRARWPAQLFPVRRLRRRRHPTFFLAIRSDKISRVGRG